MGQCQCTHCLQFFYDDRPPADQSLRGIPDSLCPYCWANRLACDNNARRSYTPEERLLVSAWDDQWDRLSDLLIKVFSSTDLPDIYDEIVYVSLRSWFLEHQDEFLEVFAGLYEASVVSTVYDDSDEFPEPEEVNGAEVRHWNPFQWYYREQDIYMMAEENNLLGSTDPWEPNKFEVAYMRFDFSVTKSMMAKLRHSISVDIKL